MTMSDLQDDSRTASLFLCDFLYNCAAIDKISTDSASLGPCVGASLVLFISGDLKKAKKQKQRLVKMTPQHQDECKRLLQLMGIPYIEVFTYTLIIDVMHDLCTPQNN